MNNLKRIFSGKLQLLVLALVILNSCILVYALFLKPNHQVPRPGKLIIDELQLEGDQISSFEKMKQDHRSHMNQLDEEYKQLLTQYLNSLKDKQTDTIAHDSLEKRMAAIQVEKAQITFHHFVQLKSICREDQQKKLTQIVPELINVMAPVHKNQRP